MSCRNTPRDHSIHIPPRDLLLLRARLIAHLETHLIAHLHTAKNKSRIATKKKLVGVALF
jgi:hypothetical protein